MPSVLGDVLPDKECPPQPYTGDYDFQGSRPAFYFFLAILEKTGENWNFWGFLVARFWPENRVKCCKQLAYNSYSRMLNFLYCHTLL